MTPRMFLFSCKRCGRETVRSSLLTKEPCALCEALKPKARIIK